MNFAATHWNNNTYVPIKLAWNGFRSSSPTAPPPPPTTTQQHQHFPLIRRNSLANPCMPRRTNCVMVNNGSVSGGTSPLLDAAKYTVDNYIRSGMVVGLGSGLASGMIIQYLGRQLREGALQDIVGIPTSVSSASEAAKAGIPLDHYQDCSQIDFAFDDADIIEEGTLISVIGRRKLQGGESIIQEKSILNTASKLAFLVTEKQYTGGLEGSIPVLIHTCNWMETAEEIDDMFLGDAEVWRRAASGIAGPLGGNFPLVTREGHNVLDLIFTSPILNLAEVAESLDKIDGVVDHGIISGIPCTAVIASEYGLRTVNNFSKNEIMGL